MSVVKQIKPMHDKGQTKGNNVLTIDGFNNCYVDIRTRGYKEDITAIVLM